MYSMNTLKNRAMNTLKNCFTKDFFISIKMYVMDILKKRLAKYEMYVIDTLKNRHTKYFIISIKKSILLIL